MKENLITLRSLRWPDDRAALLALDASFTTDRVFRLERTNNCVTLEEVGVEPPLLKAYPLASRLGDWVSSGRALPVRFFYDRRDLIWPTELNEWSALLPLR